MSTMQVTPGSGQSINLPPPDGRAAASASRPVTLCTEDQAALAAVASSAKQDTEISLLTSVRDAIKAQIALATSIWTDNSGAYFVRRDSVNEGTGAITVSFTDPTGTTATPGAGLRPLASTDQDVIEALFDVLTTGTGYTAGDLLARVAIYNADKSTATFVWFNLTAGTILGSAPIPAHVEKSEENIGARQVGAWAVSVGNFPATQPVSIASAVPVAGNYVAASGSFTRPANVIPYAAGQIIANSLTASSCIPIPLPVGRAADKTGAIRRASLKINDSAWLNATVRVHLFQDAPTYAVGDGGTVTGNLSESGYFGYCDVTLDRSFSSTTVKGHGVPAVGAEINFIPSAGTQNVFAVLEARSAVTPGSAKVFTVTVEALQN